MAESSKEPATDRQIHALRMWGVHEDALEGVDKQLASAWLSEFVSAFREHRPHRPDIREHPPGQIPLTPVSQTTAETPEFRPASQLAPSPPPTPPAPAPTPTLPTTPPPRPSPTPMETDEETEEMSVLRAVVFPEASDAELRMVLAMARQLNLDPRRGQIRAFRVGGRPVVAVGIDGYRVIAEDTGEYDGQDPPHIETDPAGKLISATVTVYRRGMSRGVSATAWWDEYARDTPPWRNMPRVMLAKVAEALALRKAFPRGLSGTYTPEEMDQATHTAPLSPPQVASPAVRRARSRREAPETPSLPDEAQPHPVGDSMAEITALIARIRAYLSDLRYPVSERDAVLRQVTDMTRAWGVPGLEGLVQRAAHESLRSDIVSDLAAVVSRLPVEGGT